MFHTIISSIFNFPFPFLFCFFFFLFLFFNILVTDESPTEEPKKKKNISENYIYLSLLSLLILPCLGGIFFCYKVLKCCTPKNERYSSTRDYPFVGTA